MVSHPASLGSALHVRLAIRLMVKAGVPVPPDWLVAWRLGLHHRTVWVPACRCNLEYVRLFAVRFKPSHPDGMRMTAPEAAPCIRQQWQIAAKRYSLRFPGVQEVTVGRLGYGGPPEFEGLEQLFHDCAFALRPLSRLLGRNPQARGPQKL